MRKKTDFYSCYLGNDRVGIFYNISIAKKFCEFLEFYDFCSNDITIRKEAF